MKILLSLLLTLTIFADFSVAVAYDLGFSSISNCENAFILDCAENDFHSSSDQHEHNQNYPNCCHAGHVHVAIFQKLQNINSPYLLSNKKVAFPYLIGEVQNVHLSLIRPPIS